MIIYLQMIESDEDKSKFEQLYIMYKGLMFHVAMKILKNEFDAEDAVHQAFLSLIENLKKISDVKCPKTRAYIVIITERKAIDIIRSRSKLVDMEFWESTYGIEIAAVGGNVVMHNGINMSVPEGSYYMLGDNADDSYDSRYWDDPFVPVTTVVAKVWLPIGSR